MDVMQTISYAGNRPATKSFAFETACRYSKSLLIPLTLLSCGDLGLFVTFFTLPSSRCLSKNSWIEKVWLSIVT